MKKRIIICCDGTWNAPDKNPTNVVKLVRAIRPLDSHGVHQVVFYDQGVGTQGGVDKWIGGGFGKGVRKNILDGYRFLVHNFQPGDEIYCFGFSRGAYTARALGGMLNAVGLIGKDELSQLTDVYKYYRTHPEQRATEKYQSNYRPDVTMIGVWDTVGALGAPTPVLGRFTKRFVSFFDTKLSPYIKNAYHALAIDEQRGPFKPDLWTGQINADQTVEQVWFAGVHSDIGGGYRERGLSDIALQWMIEKSQDLGLEFDANMIGSPHFLNPDIMQPIHDSYGTGYKLLSLVGVDRFVRRLSGAPNNPPVNVSIHPSVELKREQDAKYRPANYEVLNKGLDNRIVALDEQRRKVRQQAKVVAAKIAARDSESDCELINYSALGGAMLRADCPVDVNDKVAVSSEYFAKTMGDVVWKEGDRIGVQFAH